MTNRPSIACLAMLLLPLVGCATGVPYEPPSAPLVLRGVTLIDGTGREPATDRDVVIEGERIVGIHASRDRPYPSGWRVLDLPGLYVMPGLIDTHAHVTIPRATATQLLSNRTGSLPVLLMGT